MLLVSWTTRPEDVNHITLDEYICFSCMSLSLIVLLCGVYVVHQFAGAYGNEIQSVCVELGFDISHFNRDLN